MNTAATAPGFFYSEAILLQYGLSLSRIYLDRKTLMGDSVTARCPGPVVAKQAQIITPPPAWSTVGVRRFC